MIGLATAAGAAAYGVYRLIAQGAITVDVGLGRSVRPLGPASWQIAAPRDVVFDVLAEPYLGKTPHALREKLLVWERGDDMALAAHFTPAGRFTATTVETVRFDRPHRIDFRLVRGPVPHVRETFLLDEAENGTSLAWSGELGTDLWALGRWWGDRVERVWERAVRDSLAAVCAEAERRAR